MNLHPVRGWQAQTKFNTFLSGLPCRNRSADSPVEARRIVLVPAGSFFVFDEPVWRSVAPSFSTVFCTGAADARNLDFMNFPFLLVGEPRADRYHYAPDEDAAREINIFTLADVPAPYRQRFREEIINQNWIIEYGRCLADAPFRAAFVICTADATI